MSGETQDVGLIRLLKAEALAAEKVRSEARRAADLATPLLRSEDPDTRKAGHDLMHHLSQIVGWCNAHDAAMRDHLRAALDTPREGQP